MEGRGGGGVGGWGETSYTRLSCLILRHACILLASTCLLLGSSRTVSLCGSHPVGSLGIQP